MSDQTKPERVPMPLVIIESPFAADSTEAILNNIRYARAAMKDCLKRGEAPYASHLLYTQEGVLDDTNKDERRLGMEAGFAWGKVAHSVAVYEDLGITRGMKSGITRATNRGLTVEYRKIPGWQ